MKKTTLAIKDNSATSDACWIGIDKYSGGYPYRTLLKYARIFETKKEAKGYYDMFPKEDWSLYQIEFSEKLIFWNQI